MAQKISLFAISLIIGLGLGYFLFGGKCTHEHEAEGQGVATSFDMPLAEMEENSLSPVRLFAVARYLQVGALEGMLECTKTPTDSFDCFTTGARTLYSVVTPCKGCRPIICCPISSDTLAGKPSAPQQSARAALQTVPYPFNSIKYLVFSTPCSDAATELLVLLESIDGRTTIANSKTGGVSKVDSKTNVKYTSVGNPLVKSYKGPARLTVTTLQGGLVVNEETIILDVTE